MRIWLYSFIILVILFLNLSPLDGQSSSSKDFFLTQSNPLTIFEDNKYHNITLNISLINGGPIRVEGTDQFRVYINETGFSNYTFLAVQITIDLVYDINTLNRSANGSYILNDFGIIDKEYIGELNEMIIPHIYTP